ncbi:MAG: argininosuccinate lyase [Armatimonadota bacterium]|nr:argininosuccinate lyase [Armatimonadota bacterium]
MIKSVKLSVSRRVARSVTGLLCLLSLTCAPSAMAGGAKQDFTLHNNTGFVIHKLFTSPTTTNDWEEDALGRDRLPNGQSAHITFAPRQDADKWDLKVEDPDGKNYEWHNLDLSRISDLTLHWDKDANKGTDDEKMKETVVR